MKDPIKILIDDIFNKLSETFYYYLIKAVKPDMKIENVTELTEEMIIMLKQKLQVEGIIIDVDETLRKDMKVIPKCNQEWLEMVMKHLKVVAVSNGRDDKIKDYCEKQGITYISNAWKPLNFGFKKACKIINTEPEKVLVIGDNLVDDIYGGKKNKMKTIEVRDVQEDEER